MISEIFLGSVILSVFYIFWLYLKERKTFARLPYKWNSYPLIGNIDLLKGNPDNNGYLLFEISQKLGQPLLSFRQYGFYFVAINDYPSYKELMVEHGANTAGRMGIPKSSFINKEMGERSGIFFNEGPDVALFRRKMITLLHTFGFGQSDFETNVVEQTERTCEKLIEGDVIDPQNRFTELSAGLISTITFSRSFSIDEPHFQKMVDNFNVCLEGGVNFPLNMLLPYKWMAQLPIFDPKSLNSYHALLEIFAFLEKEMFEYNAKNEDFDRKNIFSETQKFVSSKGKKFNDIEMRGLFFDIYMAGLETTASTLSWLAKLMAEYPEIQENVFSEVSEVSGIISRNRIDEVPYTNAVIHEALRFASIVTMILPHKVTEDFTSKSGHFYPKGTLLMGNMWAINRDPKIWDTPDQFNPGHFINSDGTFKDREEFLPFGAGPRSCVGKNLAKIEVLIAFTTLMRRCRIEKPVTETWDINDSIIKTTRRPSPFKLKFTTRD